MVADYPVLIVALVLLWFPRQLLRLQPRARRLASRARAGAAVPQQVVRDDSLNPKVEFAKSRNWIDLVRAATGAFAIFNVCFETSGEGSAVALFFLKAGIALVAVTSQMARVNHGRLTLVAPVFFVMGLSFVLLGWKAALFANVTVWVLSRVLPGPGSFLFAFATLLVGFGMLFRGVPTSYLAFGIFLTCYPLLLSAVLKRPLIRVNKKPRKAAA